MSRVVQGLRVRGHHVRTVRLAEQGVAWSDDLAEWTPVRSPKRWRPYLRAIERPVRLGQTLMPFLPYFNFFDSLRFADASHALLAGVDVLYERHSFMAYGGLLLSRQMKIPLLLEVNGHPFDELEHTTPKPLSALQDRVSRSITRCTLACATWVLPSGHGWENRLVETGLLSRHRSHVIWPGTDFALFSQERDIQATRARWGFGEGPVICFVGGFDAWQGLVSLINAFAQVRQHAPRTLLALVGSGVMMQEMRVLAEELGCARQVRFLGKLSQEEVAEVLALADIGVTLYERRAEFVGMKLFDYMASGTAIIVTSPRRPHDLIVHGEAGLVIDPGSTEQLVEALRRLLADPGLRSRLGQAAREEARQRHTWAHRVFEIEELACSLSRGSDCG